MRRYRRVVNTETGGWTRETPWMAAHNKPKRSPVEGQVGKVAEQNRQQQTADYGKAQDTLSQFEGPVEKSGMYKALLRSGTEGTSNAYQNVLANTRARANQAGFGEQQPITQGAETQVGVQEAKDLAAQPGKAYLETVPTALSAASQTAGMGTELGREAEGYSGQQVDLEKQYQQQQAQFGSGLFNSLLGVGMDVATGGLSGALGNVTSMFKNKGGGYQDPNSGYGYA